MATITPTNLRTKRQDSSFYLSVFQPATLLAAQVANASIARGARTIAYDTGTGSGFATIEAFQLLEVDTATGTEYVRVKSITGNQVNGTLTVDENGINWQDNLVIRVKHFYPLVAIPPSIRSQIFYKFYDVVYSDQNSLVNPVAIIGSHLVGVLSAGSVAFSLNSSSSYAVAQGATISSRVWSCVHNGGGTGGVSFSSTTAANPTLTITQADQYWLKCTVTDSNGKTQSTYRAIFVYASLASAYVDFSLDSLTGDWSQSGWQLSLGVTGQATLSDFPDGALAVVWHVNKFDGVVGYIDLWGTAGQQIVCAGYLRRDQDNDRLDDGTGRVSFSVTTPESLIDNMSEMGSISLNAVATPTKWYEYASWLTIGRAIHHLLKWHSSVLETCDVLGLTDNTLGVKNVDFTEPSVLQMVNSVAFSRGHFARLVSSRLGRLYFVTDSQMLNTAGRAALDTVFTLSVADISGTVDVVRQPEANITLGDLDGFSFNGTTSTPFISIMPGYRESSVSFGLPGYRGAGNSSTKSQVLNNQTDANEKIGRVFAAANNNPQEMRLTTPGNYLGAFDIVPSIGFYEWGPSDATLKRDTPLNGRLLICRNVSHQINHEAGTIQTSVVFEPEAIGPDGIQGNYPVGYPSSSISGGGVPRQPSWDSDLADSPARFLATAHLDADDDLRLVAGNVETLVLGAVNTTVGTITKSIVVGLSPGVGVVVYKDTGNNEFRAAVVSVSNVTIAAIGAPATIAAAGLLTLFDAKSISSSSVAVIYGDYAVILSISGTTVTVGTPFLLSLIGADWRQITPLGNGLLFCTFNGTLAAVSGSVLTFSGTTISAESALFGICGIGTGNPHYVEAFDSQTAAIIHEDSGNIRVGLAYNISASSISGDSGVLLLNPGNSILDICKVASNKMLAIYLDASDNIDTKIVTWNGSSGLTDGAVTQISAGTNARYSAAGVLVRGNTCAVTYSYRDDAGTSFKWAAKTVTINGTNITDNADESIIVSSASAVNLSSIAVMQ